MKVIAYLIHTRHGSGQSPQIVDRLTFDVGAAHRAEESGSVIEELVTLSEARQDPLPLLRQAYQAMARFVGRDHRWQDTAAIANAERVRDQIVAAYPEVTRG
jgi:hypothetical protein